MPRRTITILACTDGEPHRMHTPLVWTLGDGSSRCWVGVLCSFGGVPRVHCLAPATDDTDDTDDTHLIVQITTAPDTPYLWPDEASALMALARWMEQEE